MGALSEENAAADPAAVGAVRRNFDEPGQVRQLQPHEPWKKQLVGL